MQESNKSRPKFRLIWLFAFITVIAFFVAAHESHRRARIRLEEIDKHVEAAIEEIGDQIYLASAKEFERLNASRPQIVEPFKTGNTEQPYGSLRAYHDIGNSHSQSLGGLFEGSAEIERDIFLGGYIPPSLVGDGDVLFVCDQKVRINVVMRIPWRVFAGKPRVRISVYDAPLNDEFVQILTRRLGEQNVPLVVERTTEP